MVDNEKDKVAELKQKFLSYKTTAEKIKEDEQLYFQFKKYILLEKFSKEVANINDEDILDDFINNHIEELNWEDMLKRLEMNYKYLDINKDVIKRFKERGAMKYSEMYMQKQYFDKLAFQKMDKATPSCYKYIISPFFYDILLLTNIRNRFEYNDFILKYLSLPLPNLVEYHREFGYSKEDALECIHLLANKKTGNIKSFKRQFKIIETKDHWELVELPPKKIIKISI